MTARQVGNLRGPDARVNEIDRQEEGDRLGTLALGL
jgi:hypothetical protein